MGRVLKYCLSLPQTAGVESSCKKGVGQLKILWAVAITLWSSCLTTAVQPENHLHTRQVSIGKRPGGGGCSLESAGNSLDCAFLTRVRL